MASDTDAAPPRGSGSLTRPCVKCKAQEATLDSRSQAVCADCFVKFVSGKCVKQMGILGKETRPADGVTTTRRYLVGLSRGVSSTVLLHLLNENVEFQAAKGRPLPFELVVVFVDDGCLYATTTREQEDSLSRYRRHFPRFTFLAVPLTAALELEGAIDWSLLPLPRTTGTSSTAAAAAAAKDQPTPDSNSASNLNAKLQSVFNALPSVASRADLLRVLTRHILLSAARSNNCSAVLLGHSTTALAELTLAEAAKGRGFSLPWQINDGPVPGASSGTSRDGVPTTTTNTNEKNILIYHPLRDVLRKELVIYSRLVTDSTTATPTTTTTINISTPKLPSDLLNPSSSSPLTSPLNGNNSNNSKAILSHKDLSIEQVMSRYFAEVEENYPSVVANVARTTGKLMRRLFDNDDDDDHFHHSHHSHNNQQQQHPSDDEEEGDNDNDNDESKSRARRIRTRGGCAICGMPLDERGDERWRGELGIGKGEGEMVDRGSKGQLCYGCERTIQG